MSNMTRGKNTYHQNQHIRKEYSGFQGNTYHSISRTHPQNPTKIMDTAPTLSCQLLFFRNTPGITLSRYPHYHRILFKKAANQFLFLLTFFFWLNHLGAQITFRAILNNPFNYSKLNVFYFSFIRNGMAFFYSAPNGILSNYIFIY